MNLFSLLCRWFRWWCPKPPVVPAVPLVPVPSCAHGCVIHRGSQGEIDGLKALGVTLARSTFYTAQDLSTSTYRAAFGARLLALDAAGIESLIVVHDFPTWVSVVPAMVSLVASFPNRTWQVGNEWDAQPWSFCNTGSQYAVLMQQVITACPGVSFAGMGLATTPAGDAARWTAFVQSYFASSHPTLEAWCIHSYANVPAQVAAIQSALLNRFPLWITEYNQVPIPAFAALGVERAYWYCYWDAGGPQGLVNADDSHRPAWNTMHTLAGATP